MTDRVIVPMDPESNWDICPVCREHLARLAGFPGVEKMRAYHEEHKALRREQQVKPNDQ